MNHSDELRNREILAKLAQSRAEIRRVLDPPPRAHAHAHTQPDESAVDGSADDTFPRSRTMKLLLSGRGLGTVSAALGGLLVARPALALRLLRMLPTGAVARMLLVKGITALRSRQE